MFTGIVESIGELISKNHIGENIEFGIKSSIIDELKIDQSISHDGICLTVTKIENQTYTVVAIAETIRKTSVKNWQLGKQINLERCMSVNARFDGHIVQGHVDATIICKNIIDENGSFVFEFDLPSMHKNNVVEKGSITINGISLTVWNVSDSKFSVAIIPYTWEFTNMKDLKIGDEVNIEFDIVGKYILRFLENRESKH